MLIGELAAVSGLSHDTLRFYERQGLLSALRTDKGYRRYGPEAAARLMRAIESVTADARLHTRDLGGQATTAQVTQAVCARLLAGATQRQAA